MFCYFRTWSINKNPGLLFSSLVYNYRSYSVIFEPGLLFSDHGRKHLILSRDCIEGLNEKKYNWRGSCRSELIRTNLVVVKGVALMDKAEAEIKKSVQHKRGPNHRQLK
jgi:hypothetical protein